MTPRALLAPARLAGLSVLRTQSDERLVDLAAAGSEAAFEAIVGRYRRPLMAYLRGVLAEERADDALQQTFVKAHAAILREDRVRNLRAWLYRIAHNTAANLIPDTRPPPSPATPFTSTWRPSTCPTRSRTAARRSAPWSRPSSRSRSASATRSC